MSFLNFYFFNHFYFYYFDFLLHCCCTTLIIAFIVFITIIFIAITIEVANSSFMDDFHQLFMLHFIPYYCWEHYLYFCYCSNYSLIIMNQISYFQLTYCFLRELSNLGSPHFDHHYLLPLLLLVLYVLLSHQVNFFWVWMHSALHKKYSMKYLRILPHLFF